MTRPLLGGPRVSSCEEQGRIAMHLDERKLGEKAGGLEDPGQQGGEWLWRGGNGGVRRGSLGNTELKQCEQRERDREGRHLRAIAAAHLPSGYEAQRRKSATFGENDFF